MNILKAFLLTLLSIVVYYIPQGTLVLLITYADWNINLFNPYFNIVWIISSIAAYLLVFYFFWKPKPDYYTILDTNRVNFNIIPYLILIVIGLGLVGQPLIDFDEIIDYYLNSEIKPHNNKFAGFSLNFLYFRISSLLIAPIFEELFFRKFLFTKLLEKNKLWIAIIISSICFSAIHYEQPSNLIPTFIYGVIACIIYYKTKNIFYLVITHFLYNLSSMMYSIYGESFFDWVYGLNFNFIYWALFAFGILITILGVKKITTANNGYS